MRADTRGEHTGDPSLCELGEHVDVSGGICLLCGEWVLSCPEPNPGPCIVAGCRNWCEATLCEEHR